METVEHPQDRLLECGTAHYAVVDHHQIVHIVAYYTVGHIIYMCGEIIASVTLGYECAQLYVLYGHLLHTEIATHYLGKALGIERPGYLGVEYLCGLGLVELLLKSVTIPMNATSAVLGMNENTEFSRSPPMLSMMAGTTFRPSDLRSR